MRRSVMSVVVLAIAVSCVPSRRIDRQLITPGSDAVLDNKSRFLKAHMRDGTLFVLDGWKQDSAGMHGTGVRLGVNRDTMETGMLRVPIDSVVLFETNVLKPQNARAPLIVFTVITGAIALACATDPKSCFGSCPTFYADNDKRILAEGFSASIAPALEATDIDKLAIAPVKEPSFTLRMTNEALETHAIRSLRLLTFPARAGTEIVATSRGEFWRVDDPRVPECREADGSCTDKIAAADGIERFTVADSLDLAKREEIELKFDVPVEGQYALVLTSRQTLLHTFVFYQTLAYFGSRAGEYLASLSRGDMQRFNGLINLGRTLGGIEISKPDARDLLEMVYETGPLASDAHLIKLGNIEPGQHTLRLRMSKGHWRIDQLAVVRMIEQLQPTPVMPAALKHNGNSDPAALRTLLDKNRTLASLPGDEFHIRFDLPAYPEGAELFLEARGYYLEWMRDVWLREENAERADMMLNNPSRALRELAPEFKKWEPRMEAAFWSSRYVRH